MRSRSPGLVPFLVACVLAGAVVIAIVRSATRDDPPSSQPQQSAPRFSIDTRLGRQRIAINGVALATSTTQPPFVARTTAAARILREQIGKPVKCVGGDAGYDGRTTSAATYRPRAGGRIVATLSPATGEDIDAATLCDGRYPAVLNELVVKGRGEVATEIGAVAVGQREDLLPAVLRVRITHNARSGFPVADPCKPTLQPADFGSENTLIQTDSGISGRAATRVTSVTVRPSDPTQCLSAPSRGSFERTVLGDACELFDSSGPQLGTYERCRAGARLRVEVERARRAVAPSLKSRFATGTSIDGTVRWLAAHDRGVISGRRLLVRVRFADPKSPDRSNVRIVLADMSERIATGLPYSAVPDSFDVGLSAQLRRARPRAGAVVVGPPGFGADTLAISVYRDGRRVGAASFFYDIPATIKHLFDYRFGEYVKSFRVLCPHVGFCDA